MARISAQTCLALCVGVFCMTSSLANEPCNEVGRPCESNSRCCSGCCTSGICLKSCAPEDNPCSSANCSENEECVLEEVQCIRAPCPPVAQCILKADSDPCAIIRCRSGFRCERQCSTTPCRGTCVPDDIPAKTKPCDTVKCSAGHHCEPRRVQCFKAPCPPAVGRCVADDPCATVRCASGTHCESKPDEQCSAPPCKLVAECVPDVNPCALVLCQTGTKCVIQPGSNTATCIPIHSGRGCKSE